MPSNPAFVQGVPDKTISRREFKTCSFNRLARVVSLRFGILVFLTRRLAWIGIAEIGITPPFDVQRCEPPFGFVDIGLKRSLNCFDSFARWMRITSAED